MKTKGFKGCRLGKAPGISLSLRRRFDGGILAIVGVKSMAAIIVDWVKLLVFL